MDCNGKETQKKNKAFNQNVHQELLNEFASNVTLHGFRFLVKERGMRRVIWLIITTVCFSFSIILFLAVMKDFFEYKVITTSKANYSRSNAEFPTVSICPIVIGSYEKLYKQKLPNGLDTDIYLKALGSIFASTFVNKSSPMLQYFFEKMNSENYTVKQMIQFYELTLKEMTKGEMMMRINGGKFCHFQGAPCDIDNFTVVGSWFSSLCFQFNSYTVDKKPLIMTYKALGHGLNVVLDIGSNYPIYSLYPFDGLLVSFDRYGSSQKVIDSMQKFILKPGTYTFIEFTTKKITLLPSPYETMCGSKPYKLIRNRPYSKELCYLDCISNEVYKECGCLGHDMEELVNVEICKIEQINCYYTIRGRIFRQLHSHCEITCPIECEKITYNIDLTEGLFGNNFHSQSARIKNWTVDDITQYTRKNLLGFNINFKDFSEVHDTVVPTVTLTSLVGTIGGSIGLCLGFSFVTIFEFAFFIFDYASQGSKRNIKVQSSEKKETVRNESI